MDDYKKFENLNEDAQTTVMSPNDEVDSITEKDLQIIDSLIKDGKVLELEGDTLYKIVEKFKRYNTKKEKIVMDFGEGITFEEKNSTIIIKKDGKTLIKLDKKETKKLIANGFEGKTYVPVTGYKTVKSFEVNENNKNEEEERNKEQIKKRIKKALLSGTLIILTIPIILQSCSKGKIKEKPYPPDLPEETYQTEMPIEPSIPPEDKIEDLYTDEAISEDIVTNDEISASQITLLIDYYFKDAGTICRSIEDQKISYEDDLEYLGIGNFDYETTNQIVKNSADFIERVNNFKLGIQNRSYISIDDLVSIMDEFNGYLNEYREFINLNLNYAGYHLSTTETRLKENKERSIDLEKEKILIQQLILETSEKLNIVDLSTAKIEEITNAIIDGKMIITNSGIVIYQDNNYTNLESFLQSTDRSI